MQIHLLRSAAIATEGEVTAGGLAGSGAQLSAFLAGLIIAGLLVVPRLIRAVDRLARPEITLVVSLGVCLLCAYVAHAFHYSIALGAFLGGTLVAESGRAHAIENLVHPVRDMFAAIFFVSVGMLIDPAVIAEHWTAVLVITFAVLAGKFIGVSLGAFLAGNGTRTSIQAGFSLAQIGEFSFIIAGLGISLRATGEFLYPIAVAVSAITTLTTPWLIRASGPAASWVDRKLPRRLQTFSALYGSWLEKLRSPSGRDRSAVRRLVRLLALDTACLLAIAVGWGLRGEQLAAAASNVVALDPEIARLAVIAAALLLALPFCFGVLRIARQLGITLARTVLPEKPSGELDLGAAPRRALVVTLQLAIVLAVALPLLVVTQPFLPRLVAPLALGVRRGGTSSP